MKVSTMIQALESILENMGDVDVAVLNNNIINRAFALICLDVDCRDRKDKIIAPYLKDKDFVFIKGRYSENEHK